MLFQSVTQTAWTKKSHYTQRESKLCREGRVLPYVGYIGICCREGYGFQAVYSGIGLKIRRFGPRIGYYFPGN